MGGMLARTLDIAPAHMLAATSPPRVACGIIHAFTHFATAALAVPVCHAHRCTMYKARWPSLRNTMMSNLYPCTSTSSGIQWTD
eukprot:349737-Chlamydomonas_euryale.AAC.4